MVRMIGEVLEFPRAIILKRFARKAGICDEPYCPEHCRLADAGIDLFCFAQDVFGGQMAFSFDKRFQYDSSGPGHFLAMRAEILLEFDKFVHARGPLSSDSGTLLIENDNHYQ